MRIKNLILLVITSIILLTSQTYAQNNAEFYYKEANKMLISGQFEQAKEKYCEAIKKKPDYAEAYMGLGMAHKELGNYDEAYKATQEALNINPEYYQAYYNLGLILENQNKNQEAIKAYEKFLKEVPGSERFTDAKQRIYKLKNKK